MKVFLDCVFHSLQILGKSVNSAQCLKEEQNETTDSLIILAGFLLLKCIFKKPKTITVETADGFKQKIKLENIKGMQYPTIQAIETTELKFYLEDIYEGENEDFAISEIRLLGMEVD